jgi:hypothetical protein
MGRGPPAEGRLQEAARAAQLLRAALETESQEGLLEAAALQEGPQHIQ